MTSPYIETAWRRFPDACRVKGSGPIALVNTCGYAVTLYPNLEVATKQLDHINRRLSRLRNPWYSFKIVDLREEGGEP